MSNFKNMSDRQIINSLPYMVRQYLKSQFDLYRYQDVYSQIYISDDYGKKYTLSYNAKDNLIYDYNNLLKKSYKAKSKVIFSKSFESFLLNNQDKKIFRFLWKLRHIAKVEKCNYITLRKDEKLSFHPRPNNQLFTDNNDWKREGRQEIKPLALLVLLYGNSIKKFISNKDIEDATNVIKTFEADPTIHESNFEEIYNISTSDWAQSSCMSGKGYIDLYNNNTDVFKAIVFKSGSEIIGRCLLVTIDDNFAFYDRIYYKSTEHYQAIVNCIIKEDKYYYKTYNTIGSDCFTYRGQSYNKTISVDVTLDINDYLPYMDTMRYYCTDDNTLQNYEPSQGYYLNDTSGGYEDIYKGIYDEIDGCYIDEDDAVCIDFGNREGCYTHMDNCFYSDANNGYCLV